MCTDIVILAGGWGERLWPVSDSHRPKQFMALPDGETFLQSAIRRALVLDIEGDICIITRREWTDLVVEDVLALAKRINRSDLPGKVLVMSEPCGKNTAPPVAWAATYLLGLARTTPINILMMASDHIINPIDSFVHDVRTACFWSDKGNLVSFAIPPVTPATGYGYIKTGSLLERASCSPDENAPAYKVDSFKEKPDARTARSYLDDGHYYWNSGIYAFRADFYLEELKRHCPEVADAFSGTGSSCTIETQAGIRIMSSCEGLDEAYAKSPSISIDYAVSEKCSSSVTVRASFLWDDVGTWDSLVKYYDDLPDNSAQIDSKNCFVDSDIPVALCGVDDLIVVIKNGRALISRKGETNLVKDALSELKKRGIS